MFEQPKGNFQKIIETLESSRNPMTLDDLLTVSNITLNAKGKSRLIKHMCMDGRFYYIKKLGKWHLKEKLPMSLWFQGYEKGYEEDTEEVTDEEERSMLNEEEGIEEVSDFEEEDA